MPYKTIGNSIYHKVNGKWVKKQTATSKKNLEKALRLLHAIEHGYKPK